MRTRKKRKNNNSQTTEIKIEDLEVRTTKISVVKSNLRKFYWKENSQSAPKIGTQPVFAKLKTPAPPS